MKKLIYMMSFLLAMAFVWTGCSKTEDPPATKFTVSFDSQGGSAVSPVEVIKGSIISKPTNPTKGTLLFVDWFKEAACTNVWNFSSDVVTANITLYAKWTTVEYTVTFNTNGGSSIAPVKVAEGSTLQSPLPPSKDGEAFENWYKNAALTTVYDFSSPVSANFTLYAKWATVTRETLRALVNDAYEIDRDNYTTISYNAMREKCEVADWVLDDPDATSVQIMTAYNELQAAIDALEDLPVREAVSIYVDHRIIDGFIYVTPGESVSIDAYASDAHEDSATDSRVTFTYNESELNGWVDGDITTSDKYIRFLAKPTITAGQTTSITIKSASKPAVSTTVILKVIAVGELKAKFINIVNTLPVPALISYNHYKAIHEAYELYWPLSDEERNDDAVKTAYAKLSQCYDAWYELPTRYSYSFNGNVCTFTSSDYGETESIKLDFVANGAFPQGTYTVQDWFRWEGDTEVEYYQSRLEFKSNGVGVLWERTSKNANGSTPWEVGDEFTYTYTGSKTAGGMFTVTSLDEYMEENSGTGVVKATKKATSIFCRL